MISPSDWKDLVIGSLSKTQPLQSESAKPTHAGMTTAVILLCLGSGSIDAISFLALGEVFASVMTGNVIFLGVSAIKASPQLALFCGIALTGYCLGGAASSFAAARMRPAEDTAIWPVRVTRILGCELALLIGLGVTWLLLDGRPTTSEKVVVLALAAMTMGMQGGTIRALGVNVSTTYMTGALTTMVEAAVVRRRFSYTEWAAIGGLGALATGAIIGAAVLQTARPFAMFVPCLGLSAVVITRTLAHRKQRASAHTIE